MKILKKADIIKLKQVDHVISENTILADIDHPFLVRLIFVLYGAMLKYVTDIYRSDLKDSPKIPATCTFSWTIFLVVNFSPT